ncbi:MAG: ribosome maturation factor RimP [Ectothiorhodospiraceae bacterium]|nr:ribosome maturation factor RimP [Ectothiorhodospiraceae bacterium]MCH8506331.1 ribosome maturation factor RimP [Ectothiorhodospiraceae bacterium]
MDRIARQLNELFQPVVEAMGYELVGVEYRPNQGEGLLRVYIDAEAGITLEDCERVSHQLSGLLDVEDPIRGHYRLEISSPGLDRPLFSPEHYRRFAGARVQLRLAELWEGRRKFRGELRGFEDGRILVSEEGVDYAVPLEVVDRANLIPEV